MELTHMQELMETIFSNMKDAVCITTKNGIPLYTNHAAEKLFGICANESEKRAIWRVIPYVERNDNLIQLFIDAVEAKETTAQDIVEYENNEGKVFHLRVSLTYNNNERTGEQFVIVVSDLTEFVKVHSAFARYTSSQIAEYVLDTPEGEKQGGTLKEVSILMSDLRGFTAMSTRLSPDDLINMLNHYFAMMVDVIEQYGGTIIEFLGDGIFVVFGAPKHDPEHALHAAACAIEMQKAMAEVNKWNREKGFPELEMGIGINSGDAVVGNIGSEQKMKYGCMGETVNLAGRVESFTIGGQIFITERTKMMIREVMDIASSQSFLPKGAREEMMIYGVTGVGSHHLEQKRDVYTWKSKRPDAAVSFKKLDGKYVQETDCTGRIVRISEDERYALMVSSAPLKKAENIMIDIGGDLYAKVISGGEEGWLLCFTAKPDCFASWEAKL